MEHWLIVDITFLDVHLQLWMLLVTAVVCLRLGDPVAFAPPIEGNCFTAMAGFRRKEYRNERAIRPTD